MERKGERDEGIQLLLSLFCFPEGLERKIKSYHLLAPYPKYVDEYCVVFHVPLYISNIA